ncbi:MAG: hypothetical protein M0Z25_09335 [Nitrospiraceae bacterium]|nr:hypothetical protein [Nitrospiraceae bacterium]
MMTARQLSKRGGSVFCEVRGERVLLSGRAVTYLAGEIDIPLL